jgi:hypothetical protein
MSTKATVTNNSGGEIRVSLDKTSPVSNNGHSVAIAYGASVVFDAAQWNASNIASDGMISHGLSAVFS